MSKRPDYISSSAIQFNQFQGDLHTAVTLNAVQWGISAPLLGEFTQWSTNYVAFYSQVSIKDKRTKEALDNYKAFVVDYVFFLRSFVQGSLVNNALIPIGTRGALGLNPRGLSPRQPKEKITTEPIVKLIPLGGGLVRFNFKVDAASRLAHMHPDSNGIAIYYRFSSIGNPAPLPPPVTSSLGAPVLTHEEGEETDMVVTRDSRADNGLPTTEGYELYVSTRAQFMLQFSLSDIGKMLHVYARWINSSKPQNSGNFSNVSSMLIG